VESFYEHERLKDWFRQVSILEIRWLEFCYG
jgi:hypothetical protein